MLWLYCYTVYRSTADGAVQLCPEGDTKCKNVCESQPDGKIFPHDAYRHFIVCIDGAAHEHYCSIEFDFDASTGKCYGFQTTSRWTSPTPEEVTTPVTTPMTTPATTPAPPKSCSTAPDFTTFPHPICTMYYFCYGHRAHEDECLPDMHFHVQLKMCNYIELANCTDGEAKEHYEAIPLPSFPTDYPPSDTTTPLPSSTTTTSAPTIQTTTTTTTTTTIRPHPTTTTATRPPTTTPRPSTTTIRTTIRPYPTTTTTRPQPSTTITTAPILPTSTVWPPTRPPRICPPANGDFSVFLPHADCERFYHCVWGVPIEMHCPRGLHFNVQINACDYPERAGCIGQA